MFTLDENDIGRSQSHANILQPRQTAEEEHRFEIQSKDMQKKLAKVKQELYKQE